MTEDSPVSCPKLPDMEHSAQQGQKRCTTPVKPDSRTCIHSDCLCSKVPKLSDDCSESLNRVSTDLGQDIKLDAESATDRDLPKALGGLSTHNIMSYCSVQNLVKEKVEQSGHNADPSKSFSTSAQVRCDRPSMEGRTASSALCSFRYNHRDMTELVIQQLASSGTGYNVHGINSLTSEGSTVSEPPHPLEGWRSAENENQPLNEGRTCVVQVKNIGDCKERLRQRTCQPEPRYGTARQDSHVNNAPPDEILTPAAFNVRPKEAERRFINTNSNLTAIDSGSAVVANNACRESVIEADTDSVSSAPVEQSRGTLSAPCSEREHEKQIRGRTQSSTTDMHTELTSCWTSLVTYLKLHHHKCPFLHSLTHNQIIREENKTVEPSELKSSSKCPGVDASAIEVGEGREAEPLKIAIQQKNPNPAKEDQPLRQLWQSQRQSTHHQFSGHVLSDDFSCRDDDEVKCETEPRPAQTASSLQLEQNLRLASVAAIRNMTSGCPYMPWTGNVKSKQSENGQTETQTASVKDGGANHPLKSFSGSDYCSSQSSTQSCCTSEASCGQKGEAHNVSHQVKTRDLSCWGHARSDIGVNAPDCPARDATKAIPCNQRKLGSSSSSLHSNVTAKKPDEVGHRDRSRSPVRSDSVSGSSDKSSSCPSDRSHRVCNKSVPAPNLSSSADSVQSDLLGSARHQQNNLPTSHTRSLYNEGKRLTGHLNVPERRQSSSEPSAEEEDELLELKATGGESLDDMDSEDELRLLADTGDAEDLETALAINVFGRTATELQLLSTEVETATRQTADCSVLGRPLTGQLHNCSNNTVIRSSSSSQEVDQVTHNGKREDKHEHVSNSSETTPVEENEAEAVTFPQTYTPRNDKVLPSSIFSFQSPAVFRRSDANDSLNPGSSRDDCKTDGPAQSRFSANSAQKPGIAAYSKSPPTPKIPILTKQKAYIGPFSGFGPNSQIPFNSDQTHPPKADTCRNEAGTVQDAYFEEAKVDQVRERGLSSHTLLDAPTGCRGKQRIRCTRYRHLSHSRHRVQVSSEFFFPPVLFYTKSRIFFIHI